MPSTGTALSVHVRRIKQFRVNNQPTLVPAVNQSDKMAEPQAGDIAAPSGRGDKEEGEKYSTGVSQFLRATGMYGMLLGYDPVVLLSSWGKYLGVNQKARCTECFIHYFKKLRYHI